MYLEHVTTSLMMDSQYNHASHEMMLTDPDRSGRPTVSDTFCAGAGVLVGVSACADATTAIA